MSWKDDLIDLNNLSGDIYAESVNMKVRRQYTPEAETAALRQKDTKPEAYATYTSYVEQCKAEAAGEDFTRLKSAKSSELACKFQTAEMNAFLMSSLGFPVDANDRANRDVQGLIATMTSTQKVQFCDYNNEFHELTKAQVKTIQAEIVENAQYLYQQKWAYRTAIDAAGTKADIDAIVIEFHYINVNE